jgi:hypothetical protein
VEDDAVFDGAILQSFGRSFNPDSVHSIVHKPLDGMALSASDVDHVARFEILNQILPYYRVEGIGVAPLDKSSEMAVLN